VIDLKLAATDGIVFGERLPDRAEPADAGEMLTAQVRSRRFGMVVSAAISRARVMAGSRDLHVAAVLGTGAAALIILLLGLGALRRPKDLLSTLADAMRAAIGARPDFRIGFNLSARHFLDETIVDDVRAIFGPSPIAPNQVLLKVTERQPLDNLDVARRVIAALQALGTRVGIDDVGTGHSGLSYMRKLGVDFIKIDKMFVDDLDTERYSATIIETLVGLARDMRMEIIAEGVETSEQVQHLRAHGIRRAQGYVFAPPLPGPSFLQLLEAAHGAAFDALSVPDAPVAALGGVKTVPLRAGHSGPFRARIAVISP
jgi:EAL domain-containing protein (putative c-di-GMP-specific phosphodiesterase class I)